MDAGCLAPPLQNGGDFTESPLFCRAATHHYFPHYYYYYHYYYYSYYHFSYYPNISLYQMVE